MSDFWVTFRLASDATYQNRYDAMLKAMVALRGTHASWGEPTSFWLVRSASALDAFAKGLSAPLVATKDLLVVRDMKGGQSRYFGSVAHTAALTEMLPGIKKLA